MHNINLYSILRASLRPLGITVCGCMWAWTCAWLSKKLVEAVHVDKKASADSENLERLRDHQRSTSTKCRPPR